MSGCSCEARWGQSTLGVWGRVRQPLPDTVPPLQRPMDVGP